MMPEGLDRIRNARILVVEDSVANQTLARDLLLHAGAHVDLAGNGREAIKAIENAAEPYDAVLMDLQMPIMDGLEATGIIRRELAQDSLPIIATTANTEKREQKLCMDAGANDYLPKPFHIHELYAVLIRWLKPVERAPEAAGESRNEQPAANGTVLPDSVDGVDIKAGLARTGQNRTLLAQLLVEFANTNMGLGQEADVAAAAGDLERVRFLAHGIRSTAGTIGAEALSGAATAVEREIVDGGDGLPELLKLFRAELEGVGFCRTCWITRILAHSRNSTNWPECSVGGGMTIPCGNWAETWRRWSFRMPGRSWRASARESWIERRERKRRRPPRAAADLDR
jgi:two-component system sensor histidine kinase/response regulator